MQKALLRNLDGTEREVESEYGFGQMYVVPEYELEVTVASFWEGPVIRQRLYKLVGADQLQSDATGAPADGRFIFQEIPGGKRMRSYRDAAGQLQMEYLEDASREARPKKGTP